MQIFFCQKAVYLYRSARRPIEPRQYDCNSHFFAFSFFCQVPRGLKG